MAGSRSAQSPPTPAELARVTADPTLRVGRYLLLELLGTGGFGAVYRAWDPDMARVVAVKVLAREGERARARFVREVQVGARLRHPGIVTTYDCGQDGSRAFLVMELVPGRDLIDLCSQRALPPTRAAEIVKQLAEAIDYAHAQNIWHRDLKPHNVIIDCEGAPRVLDFGLAFLREDSAAAQRLSSDGTPLGTPSYMAPEQVRGEATEQTDVWGLGAVLYHTLSGRAPYGGVKGKLTAAEQGEPTPLREVSPDVPVRLEQICQRCLCPRSEDRYPSPGAVAEALQGYLDVDEEVAPPRNRLALALAVLPAVGLVLGLGVWSLRADSSLEQATSATPGGAVSSEQATSTTPDVAEPTPSPTSTEAVEPDAVARVEVLLARAHDQGRATESYEAIAATLNEARELAVGDVALAERVEITWVEHDLRRGRPDAAVARLEGRSWEVEGDRVLLYAGLLAPDEQRAVTRWQALATRDPQGADGLYAQARLAMRERDLPRALELLERSAALDPGSSHAQLMQSRVYMRLRNPEAALAAVERARGLEPGHVVVLRALAEILRARGDGAGRLAARDRILEVLGDCAGAVDYVNRAQVYADLGRHDAALGDLEQALAVDPESNLALLQRGIYRLRGGQPEAGRRDLARVYARAPEFAAEKTAPLTGATGRLARAYAGRLAGLLTRRIEAVPPPARVHLREAFQRALVGAPWREVAKPLEFASRAAPGSAALALEGARLACGREVPRVAERALERARELGADSLEVEREELALLSRRGVRPRQRAAFVERLRALSQADPDSTSGLWASAYMNVSLGKSEVGLAQVRRALAHAPGDAMCRSLEATLVGRRDPQQGLGLASQAELELGLLNLRIAHAKHRMQLTLIMKESSAGQAAPASLVRAEREQFTLLDRASSGTGHLSSRLRFLLMDGKRTGENTRAIRGLVGRLGEREPDRAETQFLMGWFAVHERRRDQAAAHWQRVRELDHTFQFPPPIVEFYRRRFGDLAGLEGLGLE